MRVVIIGIDGLDTEIIDQYIDYLPSFKKIKEEGVISKFKTVFPADSVPAWQTIYTGLNPAQHGIIRGKDYVESVEDFEKKNNFKLEGKTFWDGVEKKGKKSLILNPFLAYPGWSINGVMISGPAFVEGKISKYPTSAKVNEDVYGGYKAMGSIRELKADMKSAFDDTVKLWDDFISLYSKEEFDLSFTLFTTLDRIQHYTWRFYDENDPMHEKDEELSLFIRKTLIFFDDKLGLFMQQMRDDDKLIIISDHGFGQRPFHLVNFNELFRQAGLLKIKDGQKGSGIKQKQKLRNRVVKLLSKLKILDVASSILKTIPYFAKYKKSDHLIDKDNSICFVDDLFCGKKPYCGFNFGNKIKNGSKEVQHEALSRIMDVIQNTSGIPKPNWVKLNRELYEGEYVDRLPDICVELPKDYGIEFELFGKLITNSSTHFKLSGGHYDAGTFAYYSPSGDKAQVDSVEQFHDFIISLFNKVENPSFQQVLLP
jgi:predicted AlkP superfamily phosphohydrolase/phosphomutase